MSASEYIIRLDLPIGLFKAHEFNPNQMANREFDLLIDNLTTMGMTEPPVATPEDLNLFLELHAQWLASGDPIQDFWAILQANSVYFTLISGHHRWMGAEYLEWPHIPAAIVVNPDLTADMVEAQLVRHNAIHGKMDPDKFMKLYQKWAKTNEKEAIQEIFGFADKSVLEKLIGETKKSLPKELQAEFQKASKEIKTLDDLGALLNKLFSSYGSTLPYGFMVLDFGGKDSIWIRAKANKYKKMLGLCNDLKAANRSVGDFFSLIADKLDSGEINCTLEQLLLSLPVVKPEDLEVNPEAAGKEVV